MRNRIGICGKCHKIFQYDEKDSFWYEKDVWGSYKIARCPYCGTLVKVDEEEDLGKYVNDDPRYYF